MVQAAHNYKEHINTVLALSVGESAALANLLYVLATGEQTVSMPPNYMEDLMNLYAAAYQMGYRIDKEKSS